MFYAALYLKSALGVEPPGQEIFRVSHGTDPPAKEFQRCPVLRLLLPSPEIGVEA